MRLFVPKLIEYFIVIIYLSNTGRLEGRLNSLYYLRNGHKRDYSATAKREIVRGIKHKVGR